MIGCSISDLIGTFWDIQCIKKLTVRLDILLDMRNDWLKCVFLWKKMSLHVFVVQKMFLHGDGIFHFQEFLGFFHWLFQLLHLCLCGFHTTQLKYWRKKKENYTLQQWPIMFADAFLFRHIGPLLMTFWMCEPVMHVWSSGTEQDS